MSEDQTQYARTDTDLPETKARPKAGALPKTWHPAAWEPSNAYALKALAVGEATPEQQKEALEWIMFAASGYQEFTYRPDEQGGVRDSAFGDGRRFVGQQIAKLVNMPGKVLAKARGDGSNG